MQFKKTLLATSVVASFGAGFAATEVANAGPVAAGSYDLVVLNTPIKTTAYGATVFKFGTDGAWNSSFSFNIIPSAASQGMTDNAIFLVRPDASLFGSSVVDGFAGKIGLSVSGTGAVSVSSFTKDAIAGTAGGTFAQEHGTPSQMTGTINLATGDFTFITTGREGGIDGGQPGNACAICDNAWNNDDIGGFQEYATFRTSSASGDTTTINGAVLTNIGDINGDLVDDYKAVLVSGGDVGSTWGPGFAGQDYYEVWSINLLSKAGPVIPVPAAVWLFGSGLLGLVGIARRRKTS